jgi:hypothetical protein
MNGRWKFSMSSETLFRPDQSELLFPRVESSEFLKRRQLQSTRKACQCFAAAGTVAVPLPQQQYQVALQKARLKRKPACSCSGEAGVAAK